MSVQPVTLPRPNSEIEVVQGARPRAFGAGVAEHVVGLGREHLAEHAVPRVCAPSAWSAEPKLLCMFRLTKLPLSLKGYAQMISRTS